MTATTTSSAARVLRTARSWSAVLSSGVTSPIVEVRIADATGQPLPACEQGEIWLRGVTTTPAALREAFEQAVHRQMMTDVPYGVLLSGGLDSSLVAACAARFARHARRRSVDFSEECHSTGAAPNLAVKRLRKFSVSAISGSRTST